VLRWQYQKDGFQKQEEIKDARILLLMQVSLQLVHTANSQKWLIEFVQVVDIMLV
jgi:hypothetical protein